MEFKSHAQTDIISHLNAMNNALGTARNAFLALRAEKDHFEANLILGVPGKSVAEKKINAQAKDEWLDFHRRMARAEAEYEYFKFKFRILENEYQSQYLETKFNEGLIRKQE